MANISSSIVLPLCTNRFELPGAPSTCAIDMGIVPLPSLLFMIGVWVAWDCGLTRRIPGSVIAQAPFLAFTLPMWVFVVHFLMMIGLAIINVGEIGILIVGEQGVGLLISTAFGMAVAMYINQRLSDGMRRPVVLIHLAYWFSFSACLALKLFRLSALNRLDPNRSGDETFARIMANAGQFVLSLGLLGIDTFRLFKKRSKQTDVGDIEFGRVRGPSARSQQPDRRAIPMVPASHWSDYPEDPDV